MTGYTLPALTDPFLLLMFLLSGAASDLIVVTVRPGDDVILPCQADNSSISAVKWTRPDLDRPDIYLVYNRHFVLVDQHPSVMGRVKLVDRDLKDGDVSLILKYVNRHDAGTYECQYITGGFIEPIRTIRLQVPEVIVVTVRPGDDVILPCQAGDSSIRTLEWTRADLEEPDYVLIYRDGHLDPTQQNPFFRDRVELVDRDLKDGNASLVLKNVRSIDAGTYECQVKTGGAVGSEPISIILLQVPEVIEVTVDPGDDVTLPCQAPDSSIRAVEWIRPDLEPDTVLLSINRHLDTSYQHPSFKDRVELVDRDLKDGDVSLILKNVSRHDNGTYECRLKISGGSRRMKIAVIDSEPIRIIRLQVSEPAGSHGGLYGGLVAGVLVLVAVVVVGFWMYKRRNNNRPEPPAAGPGDTSTPLKPQTAAQ